MTFEPTQKLIFNWCELKKLLIWLFVWSCIWWRMATVYWISSQWQPANSNLRVSSCAWGRQKHSMSKSITTAFDLKQNTEWKCLRTKWWREYLDVRETVEQVTLRNLSSCRNIANVTRVRWAGHEARIISIKEFWYLKLKFLLNTWRSKRTNCDNE